ncbi:MAG: hypothetical protein IJ781_11580, partial [Atopobiaceae bacterium]|nr:hypothetical protein [Atopobiaceae bacterium]
MLLAIISLFALLFVIRLFIHGAQSFIAWLGRGTRVDQLVDGGYVENEYAEQLRTYVKLLDMWRSPKQVGKQIVGEQPRLTPTQRRELGRA